MLWKLIVKTYSILIIFCASRVFNTLSEDAIQKFRKTILFSGTKQYVISSDLPYYQQYKWVQ